MGKATAVITRLWRNEPLAAARSSSIMMAGASSGLVQILRKSVP
jgi:hypothetical protein